ncbi:hypothetical protein Trco_007398 [Trichoderma cornu-damae]|uniref:Uncharacterized protein n=1 Tax=Trichoderma cornu-damae TaxID=654480 RepID=A0A9P8TTE1_9HYPO|nr:hypothetical protein Trco_007398 [Trichoderma cornu-damae]
MSSNLSHTGFAGLGHRKRDTTPGSILKRAIEQRNHVTGTTAPLEVDVNNTITEVGTFVNGSSIDQLKQTDMRKDNSKPKVASEVKGNENSRTGSQDIDYPTMNESRHSSLLQSSDEVGKTTYITDIDAKDSEAEWGEVGGWYDVNREDANVHIEPDYVDLGEEGSDVSNGWEPVDIGSRV